MNKYIYMITNDITHYIYIGQSVNPNRRFKSHMNGHGTSKKIYNDVLKYGKNHFNLTILEKVDEENNFKEREMWYIDYYKKNNYNLYNITKGGEEPPTFVGENHPMCKFTDAQRDEVISYLINSSLSHVKIAEKTKTTTDFVENINLGKRPKKGCTYPIRKGNYIDNIKDDIIFDLQNSKLYQREIAKKYGISRSCVTMINIGKNKYNKNISYPIRQKGWEYENK